MKTIKNWKKFNESNNLSLKIYLREKYIESIEEILEEEEIYEPLWNTFWNSRPKTDNGEDIDIENFEILSMNEDEIIMCAGGDWQTPVKFKIYLDNEIKTEKISDADFCDGNGRNISEDNFIEFLFDVDLSDSDWYEFFESYE